MYFIISGKCKSLDNNTVGFIWTKNYHKYLNRYVDMRWLFYRKFLIELNFVLSMSCLYVFGAKNGDERDKSTDIRMLYL